MTFTVVPLQGNEALIRGVDRFGTEGNMVVPTHQYNQLKKYGEADNSLDDLNAAFKEFFAPLDEALDAYADAVKAEQSPVEDVIILEEAVEAVEYKPEVRVVLNHATKVLLLIERNETDRLIWVNNFLHVTEGEAITNAPVAEDVEEAGSIGGLLDDQGEVVVDFGLTD